MRRTKRDADARGRRLSALDGSFLRLESTHVHMHVAWSAVFSAPAAGPRPTVQALRERVAARLDDVGWCRWMLRRRPAGLAEPRWVSAREVDLDAHVLALSEPDESVSYEVFAAMRDEILSQPLDRARPLWQIFLVPRLADGRVGMFGKIHHSLVDGVAALQIARLFVDHSEPPARAERADRTQAHRARGALTALLRIAARPDLALRSVLRDLRRIARAVGDDLMPSAPASPLNVPVGARRTLVGYRAPLSELRAARSGGGTLNEIGLSVVAGALRAQSIQRGEVPAQALKAMIPVSMRRADELGPGNKISMVYVQLPVHLASAAERLEAVRDQMQRLKHSPRAEHMRTLYEVGELVPVPLRSPLTKALASPRVFNLTISQPPGPRGTLRAFGCELEELYSVIPIARRHALAIGMTRYRRELFIGCYADPDALPEVTQLPALLEAELRALAGRLRATA